MSLQVVVQPYLSMVLKSLSAGSSKYVQSAAPLPIEWRYMMELSVHNSSPEDVKVRPGRHTTPLCRCTDTCHVAPSRPHALQPCLVSSTASLRFLEARSLRLTSAAMPRPETSPCIQGTGRLMVTPANMRVPCSPRGG